MLICDLQYWADLLQLQHHDIIPHLICLAAVLPACPPAWLALLSIVRACIFIIISPGWLPGVRVCACVRRG